MKTLSIEFKKLCNQILEKMNELVNILNKEWKYLIKNDTNSLWISAKEKNLKIDEIKRLQAQLEDEIDKFIFSISPQETPKNKGEFIRKNVTFNDYIFYENFINKYNTLKKEIIETNKRNMRFAEMQVENVNKCLEILTPKQEQKELTYSPHKIRQPQKKVERGV